MNLRFFSILNQKKTLWLILFWVIFLVIPSSFYIIGKSAGFGIQFIFLKYQVTTFGVSIIPVTNNVYYLMNQIIVGKSAVALFLELVAFVLYLITGFIVLLMQKCDKKVLYLALSIGMVLSGIFLLLPLFIQYGFFYSDSGFFFPIDGVFLILIGSACILDRNAETSTEEDESS